MYSSAYHGAREGLQTYTLKTFANFFETTTIKIVANNILMLPSARLRKVAIAMPRLLFQTNRCVESFDFTEGSWFLSALKIAGQSVGKLFPATLK